MPARLPARRAPYKENPVDDYGYEEDPAQCFGAGEAADILPLDEENLDALAQLRRG
jgi:hypothetical protein